MARYYGHVGYGVTTEIAPGVWSREPIEKEVYGDIFKDSSNVENGEGLNDDIVISMKISFVADPYALLNYSLIKYATNLGTKWKVKSAEVQHPRIVLTLGDVYTGTKESFDPIIQEGGGTSNYVLLKQVKDAFNTAYYQNYKEISLVDGDIVSIDVWEKDDKVLKLFTQTVNYVGLEISEVITLDEVSGWELTMSISYPEESKVIITEAIKVV